MGRSARRFLKDRGYTVVDQNYRTRHGELDFVDRNDGTLVVVEVKLRRGTRFGDPLEAVNSRKQRITHPMTEEYLLEKFPIFTPWSFDPIGILLHRDPIHMTHRPHKHDPC